MRLNQLQSLLPPNTWGYLINFRQSFNYDPKMSKLGELDPKRVKRNFKVRWVEIANAKHEDAISKIKGLFTFIKGTQK